MAHKFVKIEKFEELYPFEDVYIMSPFDGSAVQLDDTVNVVWLVHALNIGDLYKKVESPWWEDIPEQGMLVWVDAGGAKWLRKVTNYHLRDFSIQNMDEGVQQYHAVECENSYIRVDKCTPLTDDEIKQFLRGE